MSRCGWGSWGLEPSSHVHFGELAIASLLAATERPVHRSLCVSLRKGRMLGDRGRSPYQHHCHLYVGLTIFKTYQLFTMCKLYHNHPLQYKSNSNASPCYCDQASGGLAEGRPERGSAGAGQPRAVPQGSRCPQAATRTPGRPRATPHHQVTLNPRWTNIFCKGDITFVIYLVQTKILSLH